MKTIQFHVPGEKFDVSINADPKELKLFNNPQQFQQEIYSESVTAPTMEHAFIAAYRFCVVNRINPNGITVTSIKTPNRNE